MFEEGVLDNPRPGAVFGLHTLATMEVGQVGFTVGPALAAVDHFIIKIRGKQGHGAAPHLTIDPVVMAAQAIMKFQTIRSRTLNPLQPSVITVGIVRGGERFNIIPGEVHLEGTVRTYDPDVRDLVEQRMNEILEGITGMDGGSYELDYQRGTPATINDQELARHMLPTLERVVGAENLVELDPTMGGGGFCHFRQRSAGVLFSPGDGQARHDFRRPPHPDVQGR